MSFSLVLPAMKFALFATFTLATISSAEIPSKCSFTQKDSRFSSFYPLSDIPNSQPDGFYAKVKVSVISDYGDVHILLAESNDLESKENRVYEFASAPHTGAEIRRKSAVYGKYEVLTNTTFAVEDAAPTTTTFEISVSTDGVVNVTILNSNATIAAYDEKSVLLAYDKYRTLSSNFSLEVKDPKPFPINFIAFSGHSKLQFNCDYGIFIDKTYFVQTRCEAIYGWYQEQLFHPLSANAAFQPDGYHAKVDISMLSDYGNMHVILSETNEKTGPNPCYEIVVADRFGTISEFRRKNSISEDIDFVNQSSFSYNVQTHRASIKMQITLSKDGLLSFTDLRKNTTFSFTDTEPTIPVKYITFGGYRKWPATYEIDCINAKTTCSIF